MCKKGGEGRKLVIVRPYELFFIRRKGDDNRAWPRLDSVSSYPPAVFADEEPGAKRLVGIGNELSPSLCILPVEASLCISAQVIRLLFFLLKCKNIKNEKNL